MRKRPVPDPDAGHSALVTNIQRFSLDDGDGIRTTIFFKGCHLGCPWCHNPECMNPQKELQFEEPCCTTCGECRSVCESGVFSLLDGGLHISREKCRLCGNCVRVCRQEALKITGKEYTVEEILREVLKDRNFYKNSGGGVTLSGGEPLLQQEFVLRLLERLKDEGIHTAIDTSGCVSQENLRQIAGLADLFLLDIKAFSPELHKNLTGIDNSLVLESLDTLTRSGSRIYIRIPLVAGVNDAKGEIASIAGILAKNTRADLVELLAYHALGASKYASLGKVYQGNDFQPP